jgi:hypothetical protein
MNQTEAFYILGIPADVCARDMPYITKAYRMASLKHHPDKNENSPESTARFQKINEAYQYLDSHASTPSAASAMHSFAGGAFSYQEIFVFFIRTMFARTGNDAVDSADIEAALMHIVSSNYDKLMKTLDKTTAVSVYEFMHEYADILHLPEDTLEKMFKIVSDKMKSDNLVILNPTLADVFGKKVYELEYESKRFSVPLWHNEMYYALTNDSDLVVRCTICDAPDYMYIDENNHITLSIRTSIQRLLDTGSITVTIPLLDQPPVEIKIPSSVLTVTTATQTYACPDPVGIPKINTRNLLDSSTLAGMSVCIELY